MRGWVVAALFVFGLIVVPYASAKLAGSVAEPAVLAVGYSITALAVGAAMEYVVRRPESGVGRVLNLGVVRHLGIISYSVYLWQQIFTGSQARLGLLTYALILAAAEVSYWLIEKPSARLRARLAI